MLVLVFLIGIWQKKYWINGNKFPVSLICPQFICECSFDFLVLCPQKNYYLLYVVTFFYIFFTRHEYTLWFININFMSRLLSSN